MHGAFGLKSAFMKFNEMAGSDPGGDFTRFEKAGIPLFFQPARYLSAWGTSGVTASGRQTKGRSTPSPGRIFEPASGRLPDLV